MANESFRLSQNVDIINKKESSAYPIDVRDWELIKRRLMNLSFGFNYLNSFGSLFVGAGLSTLITYLTISKEFQFRCLVIGIGCILLGFICFIFAYLINKEKNIRVSDTIEEMEHIERRFSDNK